MYGGISNTTVNVLTVVKPPRSRTRTVTETGPWNSPIGATSTVRFSPAPPTVSNTGGPLKVVVTSKSAAAVSASETVNGMGPLGVANRT